jgi:Zn-dependent protease with chaperone function
MATFFEHQDRARRNTKLLVLLMALGVVAMALAIYAVLIVVEQKLGARHGMTYPLLQPELLLGTVLGTAVVVGMASGVRMLSLRGGGTQIAEMMGGRLVSGSPRDVLEKRLVNVVEEMAIASGVPVPQVFVLESEQGINAFAAGFTLDDASIAVTRGCLEKLTRDELQGVIAHEFSHVLNGDMRLNIRLMGIVFGIVCIGLLGRIMLRAASSTPYASSRRSRNDNSPGAVLLVLGLAMVLIGVFGELFGKLIKAAVSRQREFLADASAVQFTRNPQGIAGALKKIGGFGPGASIAASHAEEASHFFFGDIKRHLWGGSLLATHPPLAERITRIEPSFHGEFPQVGEGVAEPDDLPVRGLASSALAAAAGHTAAPAQVAARVGLPDDVAQQQALRLIRDVPAELRERVRSPFSACAAVFALLLSDDAGVQARQRERVAKLASPQLASETLRVLPAVAPLDKRRRLSLCELLAPALRELSREQRAAFTRTVQALIEADDAISIFELVVGETLRERLSNEHSPAARARVRHKSLKSLQSELQILLSLLAHAGASDAAAAAGAFDAAKARLPDLEAALIPYGERLVGALPSALSELRACSPQLCARIVDACAYAVLADRRVTEDEATLLSAACSALGCPLPPFAEAA